MKKLLPLFILFVVFILSINCSHKKKSFAQIRHPRLDTMQDPTLKFIPDSFNLIAKQLDQILRLDQKYRSVDDKNLFKKNSLEQTKLDSLNLIKITSIIDKYGWLGVSDVGYKGYKAITMVMIHANTNTKKKYYPSLTKAFLSNKVMCQDYTLYEDKLNISSNRLQHYGTQIFIYKNKTTLAPTANPDSLDFRRKKMKLNPISEYLRDFFNTKWDLEQYKKDLPYLKKLYKISDSTTYHLVDN